ncbi:MAG: hypothetical protein ACK4R6_02875 [Spirosomataceae bacterium]
MWQTLIFTSILSIVLFLADYLGVGHLVHPHKWIILSFFVAVSYLFHTLVEQGMRNNRENFIQFYLSTVVIRLIASLIFIGVELYLGVGNKKIFILTFFVLYLFFTLFELTILYRKLRRF